MMASGAPPKSKRSRRPKTKELLAVAGLTAAEYSTSYAVQEYLGKTIQNASQKLLVDEPKIDDHTLDRTPSKLQKPPLPPRPSFQQPSRREHISPRRPLSLYSESTRDRHRQRQNRQQTVYQKAPLVVERMSTSESSIEISTEEEQEGQEEDVVYKPQHFPVHQHYSMPVLNPDLDDGRRELAMWVGLKRAGGLPVGEIDSTKLGARHEALGSHPPLFMRAGDETSDTTGSRTVVPSRSTGSGQDGRMP